MKVYLSPQVSLNDKKFTYAFEGDVITVTFDGVTDIFDFSGLGDGEITRHDVETALTINPIITAKRENDVLEVELLNFIDKDAAYEERFPDWKEV